MATKFYRPNSKYIWIKWYDPETKKPVRRSTADLIRPNGQISPCLKGIKKDEKLAEKICDEIESAKKLNLTKSYFVPLSDSEAGYKSIDEAYKHFLKNNNKKSAATKYEFKNFFKVFSKYFPGNSPCNVIDKLSVENFLLSLSEEVYKKKVKDKETNKVTEIYLPYSKNSIYILQKNMNKFLDFLFEYEYLDKYFKINKDIKHKPEVKRKIIFSDNHINDILDQVDKENSNRKTAIYLLCYSGLRSSEILSIQIEDIDFNNQVFEYYSSKAKKYIKVPIHPFLIDIFKERISQVQSEKLIEFNDHRAIRRAFNRILKKLGIDDKGYSPRTFRKSYDTWAYENGMDIIANSRIVGHSVATSEKHYREVNMNKLKKEVVKFKVPHRTKK